jgi:hypothetical protein
LVSVWVIDVLVKLLENHGSVEESIVERTVISEYTIIDVESDGLDNGGRHILVD